MAAIPASGEVHVRCESCDHCFVVGMEKGDPCDIAECDEHRPGE
jgi:hypothetical protein